MVKVHPHYLSQLKRLFDLVLAILLSIFISPIILMISLIVLITAGFPIIFKQKRTGQNGKTFTIFKFRTMKKNASLIKHKYLKMNEAPKPMFKIHNDPRFVGFGQFLSKSGFDKIPQLLNVIKGEMSFVGPRPLPVKEALALPKSWKYFREKVRPGVFSEWTLAEERHSSLKKWRMLEEKTLKKNNKNQLILILKMVIHFFTKLLKLDSLKDRQSFRSKK